MKEVVKIAGILTSTCIICAFLLSFVSGIAIEKIEMGMKIQIRDGSAAKNFDNLYTLIDRYPDKVMLCTDDCHPDELITGHINRIVKKCFIRPPLFLTCFTY